MDRVSSAATILHADLDAFYASVEQRDDPGLRDRPIAVGTGVVLAASYEARARGVFTTMNAARARQACPELRMVPPRMAAYSEASREVYAIFRETVPVVEALSIDEAFLDATGLERVKGSPAAIARALRHEVREKTGLAISIGVARTKFLAKVASGESKPDGLLVIEPESEKEFLHPLPVRRLWGVGRVTAGRLESAGIWQVGDIARTRPGLLAELVGERVGGHLSELAAGHDPRPVEPREPRRSIGAQSAFPAGSRTFEAVGSLVASLTDRVCGRLRRSGQSCRTVTLGLRYADFSRASRSRTLGFPTDRTGTLLEAVNSLLRGCRAEIDGRGLTLVSVSLSGLGPAGEVQLALPIADEAGRNGPGDADETAGSGLPGRDPGALDAALDQVRRRFGPGSIRRASGFGGEEEVAAPTLPDLRGSPGTV